MADKKKINKNGVSPASAQNAPSNVSAAYWNAQNQATQGQPAVNQYAPQNAGSVNFGAQNQAGQDQPAANQNAAKGKQKGKNDKKATAVKKEKGKGKKPVKSAKIQQAAVPQKPAPKKKLSKKEIKAAAKNKKKEAFNVKPFYDPQTGWNSHNDQILYEMACEKVHRLKKQIKQEKHPVMRHRLIDTRDNYELLIEKMIYRDYVSVNNMWNSGMLANPNPQEAARERALALAAARSAGLPEPVIGQEAKKQTIIEATTGEDENKDIRAYIKKKEKHRIRLKIVPIISLLLFLLYIVAMYVPYYMTGPYASNGLGIVLSLFDLPLLSAASSVQSTILNLLESVGLDGTEALFYKGIMEGGQFPLSAAAIQGETIFNTIMGYGTLLCLTLAFLLAIISVFMNFIRIFTGAKKIQFMTFLCFLFSLIAGFGLCLTNIVDGNFSDALFNTIGWDVSATNGMGYMLIATVFIPFIAFMFPLFFPQKSKYIDEIEKNKAKLDHEKIVEDAKEHAVEVNKEKIVNRQNPVQPGAVRGGIQKPPVGAVNRPYSSGGYNGASGGARPPMNGARPTQAGINPNYGQYPQRAVGANLAQSVKIDPKGKTKRK